LILHETVARGVTVVTSTAYMDEAERCDRVLLVQSGRAAALDAPATLQARLAGTILAVRADQPREAEAILRRQTGVRTAALFGDRIHLTLAAGTAWDTVAAPVRAGGITIHAVDTVAPSLEDVFLDLMLKGSER
jgi:ABC-2 type transport system ATP-binding protein